MHEQVHLNNYCDLIDYRNSSSTNSNYHRAYLGKQRTWLTYLLLFLVVSLIASLLFVLTLWFSAIKGILSVFNYRS